MGCCLKFNLSAVLLCVLYGVIGCSSASNIPESLSGTGPYYTAYNLWYEKPERMYGINYQKGVLVPAGTEVHSIEIGSNSVKFKDVETGKQFVIILVKKNNPDLSIMEFTERLLTTQNFAELTRGLSPLEIENIKTGQITSGMSKKAVLISFGYPPRHRTSYLNSNVWLYWSSRFRSLKVEFDEQGYTK